MTPQRLKKKKKKKGNPTTCLPLPRGVGSLFPCSPGVFAGCLGMLLCKEEWEVMCFEGCCHRLLGWELGNAACASWERGTAWVSGMFPVCFIHRAVCWKCCGTGSLDPWPSDLGRAAFPCCHKHMSITSWASHAPVVAAIPVGLLCCLQQRPWT